MLEKFWTMQWMLCPVEKDLKGAQVTAIREDISKCLNNSSRALFLNLGISAFLAVDGRRSLCVLEFVKKTLLCEEQCVQPVGLKLSFGGV